MPELPEVQTIVDDLAAAGLVGRRIASCEVLWHNTVRPLSPTEFHHRIIGLRFASLARRGKYILFGLESKPASTGEGPQGAGAAQSLQLLAHLRMTGQFSLVSAEEAPDPHNRAVFTLDDGRQLRFHDTRKFGRLILAEDPERITGRLGPEPLDPSFSVENFYAALRRHKRRIKALLLDQHFLAGLGNIYCDEALYISGIHPLRKSDSISAKEADLLLATIREVLTAALKNRGTSLGDGETNYISDGRRGENGRALQVYGRKGQKCARCGSSIEKIYVAQRGSHFCPSCQPLKPNNPVSPARSGVDPGE